MVFTLSGDLRAHYTPLKLASGQWAAVREWEVEKSSVYTSLPENEAAGPCVQDEEALPLTPGSRGRGLGHSPSLLQAMGEETPQ